MFALGNYFASMADLAELDEQDRLALNTYRCAANLKSKATWHYKGVASYSGVTSYPYFEGELPCVLTLQDGEFTTKVF